MAAATDALSAWSPSEDSNDDDETDVFITKHLTDYAVEANSESLTGEGVDVADLSDGTGETVRQTSAGEAVSMDADPVVVVEYLPLAVIGVKHGWRKRSTWCTDAAWGMTSPRLKMKMKKMTELAGDVVQSLERKVMCRAGSKGKGKEQPMLDKVQSGNAGRQGKTKDKGKGWEVPPQDEDKAEDKAEDEAEADDNDDDPVRGAKYKSGPLTKAEQDEVDTLGAEIIISVGLKSWPTVSTDTRTICPPDQPDSCKLSHEAQI